MESHEDEEIVRSIVLGRIPYDSLESKLGDCLKAAKIRREAVQRIAWRSLEGLGFEGFDYEGQCCEMPVGYVRIPVGIAGPLLVNGCEYSVPMATTEGCLVASTNRGCKAINESGGATAVVFRDGTSRTPLVRFPSAQRATNFKLFLEDPANFDKFSVIFKKFAKLQNVKCGIAGKNVYAQFTCSTGDTMGMNSVCEGVQNLLDVLHSDFPDMSVMEPASVNWTEECGKSVVCEALITGKVVAEVLRTTVGALVELNMLKNMAGSAIAGYNARAANLVAAIFLATGQNPADVVESSQCITMMEAINDGKDLHVSVTLPYIKVGTIGGGTQLASQSACLNLLGVKGESKELPGLNSQVLATIVAGSVLAGELSLMSAISAGQLDVSHMKHNPSQDITKLATEDNEVLKEIGPDL